MKAEQLKDRPMRPDERDFDEEIRGHLAINIKERNRSRRRSGERASCGAPGVGYMPAVHDEMRRVWYHRLVRRGGSTRTRYSVCFALPAPGEGLTSTVVVTLALGIGANAAILGVVRSVLLRPLVNRDAERLIYVRQTALGIGTENLKFSVPEID